MYGWPDKKGFAIYKVFYTAKKSNQIPATIRIVKVSPGKRAEWWKKECRDQHRICVGWTDVGDLSNYISQDHLAAAFKKKYYPRSSGMAFKKAGELWTFSRLRAGDKVIANRGVTEVLAVGTVKDPCYQLSEDGWHTVAVDWDTSYQQPIPPEKTWRSNTVADVPPKLIKRVFGKERLDKRDVITIADLKDARKRRIAATVEREGEQEFRRELIKAYNGRCAISGWMPIDALEAAHILQYSGPKSNHPSNGILLRADLHRLFDKQLITIVPKTLRVRVDPGLRKTEYGIYDGKRLHLPINGWQRPSPDFLARQGS